MRAVLTKADKMRFELELRDEAERKLGTMLVDKWLPRSRFEQPVMFVSYIGIDKEHQRQRLGTRLYEAAAKYACEEYHLPLASDAPRPVGGGRSPGAEAFWKKQVKARRAECISEREGRCFRYGLRCPAPASLEGKRRRR